MKDIKIKTGSNLSAILQSTVNLPQAFTELVKNSLQNFATYVKIDIEQDKILIEDDGKSFNDEEDTTGKNDFDKYFVFGNSYDTTGGAGIRLGHMGIGGKLANDKLSVSGTPNWSLHCKNANDKAFIVNYKPEKNEYLDDYSPEINSVKPEESLVKSETGTTVVINDINQAVKKRGVFINIKNELKTFFGFLVSELAKENKTFKIIFNGEPLDFDYRLPGDAFGHLNQKFKYTINGEEKESNIEFKLSMIKDRESIKGHPLQNVEIISQVKICDFHLSDQSLIEKIYQDISEELGEEVVVQNTVLNLFRNLVGFISCPDLSAVLDDTGMPAKDLSHHNLREDHPITKPFISKCYEVVIKILRTYIELQDSKKDEKFKALIASLTDMLDEFDDIDPELLMDLQIDAADKDMQDLAIEQSVKNSFNKPPANRDWHDKISDMPKDSSPKTIKMLNYEILDFGSGFEGEMSRIAESDGFKILINAGNSKFLKLDGDKNALMMSMHIAECLITEVSEYKDPFVGLKEVNDKISNFYLQMYDDMRDRFLV